MDRAGLADRGRTGDGGSRGGVKVEGEGGENGGFRGAGSPRVVG